MFNFVQNWLGPYANPIGVDLGTRSLRMAQVQTSDGEPRLIAAASADLPGGLDGDPAGRARAFAGAARELLRTGSFVGRRICLGLPASMMSILCLTLPVGDQFRSRLLERFPENAIDRLVFVGGEARNRVACRSIARALKLSASIGDPILRMGRSSALGFESGIDRREPQPAWMLAIGLSLGTPLPSEPDHHSRTTASSDGRAPVQPAENAR